MSWSKKYYEGLAEAQHKVNDVWFKAWTRVLKNTGVLFVPNLQKSFNRKGEEVIKISKQQVINETVPYNDILEANKND